MAYFTLLEGIFCSYGRHFRLQKGGRWVEDKNPLPPSEMPLYTMVSGTLVEDGREIKENVERITNKETVSRKTNKLYLEKRIKRK